MGGVLFVIMVLGIFPITAMCFSRIGPRRAVLLAIVGGWLLLPTFGGSKLIPFMHSKQMVVPGAAFIVSLLLDWRSWQSLRLKAVDLPLLVYAVVPFISS